MFCNKCQAEVEPMSDQWGNNRCPSCKQMFTAPSDSSVDSSDDNSSENSKDDESISPAYSEYLKQTSKFRSRKHAK